MILKKAELVLVGMIEDILELDWVFRREKRFKERGDLARKSEVILDKWML
jgi:hypothetical protein